MPRMRLTLPRSTSSQSSDASSPNSSKSWSIELCLGSGPLDQGPATRKQSGSARLSLPCLLLIVGRRPLLSWRLFFSPRSFQEGLLGCRQRSLRPCRRGRR
jgi:hypothetical protein